MACRYCQPRPPPYLLVLRRSRRCSKDIDRMPLRVPRRLLVPMFLAVSGAALAQMPGGPPSVGVIKVEAATITETSEFVGRVQAVGRVALTARVTAFLDERLF